MANLYLSFSVVFPLVFLLSLGYTLAFFNLHSQNFFNQINALCFEIFLPVLLFVNIYDSNFDLARSISLISFAVATAIVFFLALLFIIPKFVKTKQDCSVVIQGMFRSNIVLFGIPVSQSLFGADGVRTTSILIAFVVPVFNVIAVFLLQLFSDKKPNILSILRAMSRNPLIIASFLGFTFAGLKIPLPSLVNSSLHSIAQMVTPLALIALGATFKFKEMPQYKLELILAVLGKLVIMPVIFMPIALYFGFLGPELMAIMAMLISPTALASFTMAQNMGANGELAGQIVVVTSVAAIITIFIWVTIMQFLHLV